MQTISWQEEPSPSHTLQASKSPSHVSTSLHIPSLSSSLTTTEPFKHDSQSTASAYTHELSLKSAEELKLQAFESVHPPVPTVTEPTIPFAA